MGEGAREGEGEGAREGEGEGEGVREGEGEGVREIENEIENASASANEIANENENANANENEIEIADEAEIETANANETANEPATEPTPPTQPARATYTFDPSRSSLTVQVYKDPDTVGAALSHDHVIAARAWTGQATWDPSDLSACKVSFTVPVARLDVDPPKLRAAVGLEGELSEKQREEVKGNMLAKDQLWGDQHPNITFTSTGCAAKGEQVEVAGRLNIRGVDKDMRVTMTVSADGQSFTASGSFRAKATDFGFEPFTAGFGALKNKDAMRFAVSVTGSAR
ncbi:MAG: YceI family protein [Alphaproteobacteria bacterium]|nr:YceI family protein [Alphaproteobacteria bacterium]